MTPRLPLVSGDEQDAFTRWRRVLAWRAGERAAIKRRYNRRVRRLAVPALAEYDWPHERELAAIARDAGCEPMARRGNHLCRCAAQTAAILSMADAFNPHRRLNA